MGRAFFDVSPEIIESILELQKGMRLYGAEWSFRGNCLRLYVVSDELPALLEGQSPPRIQPRVDYSEDEGHSFSWYGSLQSLKANANES